MVLAEQLSTKPLTADELRKMDAYWRAANYLSVGQIYFDGQPAAARTPKTGTCEATPAGALGHHTRVELHLRASQPHHQTGKPQHPLHHRPRPRVALLWWPTPTWKGTYSEVYPNIGQDAEGMRKLFKQFSFPGGVPSHVAPETPGSIHEGGELGLCPGPRLWGCL
jgi:xylulose-5-phosphate/fructose-6-phosphate phosphoketolase